MKFSWFVVVLCALVSNVFAGPAMAETAVIDQSFEDTDFFKTDAVSREIQAPAAGGRWSGFDGKNFTIVNAGDDGRGQALKITRVSSGMLSVRAENPPPANRTAVVRLNVRVGPANATSAAIRFRNSQQDLTVGEVRFEADSKVAGYIKGARHFGVRTTPEAWQNLTLTFSPNAESFEIYNTLLNGERVRGLAIPFENNVPIDTIEFYTYPATDEQQENTVLLGGVHVSYEDGSSLTGRENVLLSAYDTRASVVAADGATRDVAWLNDGDVSGVSAQTLSGLPATLLFDLAQPVTVSTVRLFSGNAEYADNPSGDVSVTDFTVEGLVLASGQWRELIQVADAPGFEASGAAGNEGFFVARDFEPIEISKLRLRINDSNDTGRRADPEAREPRSAIVREVELYTHAAVGNSRKQLGGVLEAEFSLPAYRDQPTAFLHAVLDPAIADGLEVEVNVRERHTGAIPQPGRRVALKPGENRIGFEIADWADGEYRAELRASGAGAPVGGSFARLLRINRVEQPTPPATPEALTGKKMFFPDAWYLSSHENLAFELVPPEVHRVGRTFLKPGRLVQLGQSIGFSPDGKLVVTFRDMNRAWDVESVELHYATADLANLDHWEVHHGKPAHIDTTPAPLTHGGKPTGSSGITHSFGQDQKFRFYEKEKDGPVRLDELVLQHVGYKKVDWGVMQPQQQSTWLLWKKGDEWLILQKTPFLQDGLSSDEFEAPNNSNDNFAGQWISDDGKTFYYVRARLLKRYAPFVARYDNLWQAARILTVFSTQDGLEWEQRYFPLPDEADGPTAQHYGAGIYTVPAGNGLMIAYALPYSARMQQMHVEVYYSWNGGAWNRVSGHVPWVPPGKPGDWNFGLTNMHKPVVERDGTLYHLIGWGAEIPHFGGEMLYSDAEVEQIDGAYLEKRYANRGLTEWPYFDYYGSYDKLADALKGYGITPGVMTYRRDGWWALSAGDETAGFTTRPVTASRGLTANAVITGGGYIEFTLRDEAGHPMEGYTTRLTEGEGTDLPVFDSLPTQPFTVSAELRNAQLFTLNF